MILIPEDITAGFNEGNYDSKEKLAFLVYKNERKELSQPKAWEKWRNKKLAPLEFKNEPQKGFVLDKAVGGYNTRFAYRGESIRVWDPRGFEIEITLDNLLNIIKMCTCEAGGLLQGEFVYAWDKFQLILMPTISEDYKELKEFTLLKLENKNFKTKDLIQHKVYRNKENELLIFLCERLAVNLRFGVSKYQIFYNLTNNEIEAIDLKTIISEEREATGTEQNRATLRLSTSKYKENINRKSRREELIKLNWFTGEAVNVSYQNETGRDNAYLNFSKEKVYIDYYSKQVTIKEFLGLKKPTMILYFYDSGELFLEQSEAFRYNKKIIEEWCKQNVKGT